MSVILIALKNCPQEDKQAQEDEIKLDQLLDEHVKIITDEYKKNDQEFSINLMELLSKLEQIDEISTRLPKGGGIQSKQSVVEPALFKYCPKLRGDDQMHVDE